MGRPFAKVGRDRPLVDAMVDSPLLPHLCEQAYPNRDGGHNAMRLNFSYSPPELIVEGIRRLGTALKKRLSA